MSHTSILIQGPLNLENLRKIYCVYKTYGPVIVSCYETDRDKVDTQEFPEVDFVFNPVEPVTCANYANLYLHSYTTYNGLRRCTTLRVIKTRSDEYFSNLDVMIDKLKQNSEQWITHPVWFKKVEHEWLHPGDHLIGSYTFLLLKTFKATIDLCKQYSDTNKQFNIYELGFSQPFACQYPSGYLFPENVFFLNFLKAALGDQTEAVLLKHNSLDGFRHLMRTYSDVIPFEDLGHFCCTYLTTSQHRVFHTNPEDIYNDPVSAFPPIVRSISEV